MASVESALICDEDPAVRASIGNELGKIGFDTIYEAGDGNSALVLAFEALPDIAILDVACGLNPVRGIRQKQRIPVILLMSRYDPDTLNQIKRIGITTTLSKPFRGQDLLPAIEVATAHANELRQLKADVEELNRTIEDQAIIYKAKKVLMRFGELSDSESYRKIQKLAMDTKKSMRQIAETILIAYGDGKRKRGTRP